MATRIVNERMIDERARRLRGALGLRTPSGFLSCPGSPEPSIAWYQFPAPGSRPPGAQTTEEQTIVGLHDLGSGSREFHPLLPLAQSGTRLIFFDWPSHGRSSAGPALSLNSAIDLLRVLLKQLGISRPILAGCGFGAAVALGYAVRFPGHALAMVLCQPAGLVPRRSVPSPPKLGNVSSPAARRQALRTFAVGRTDAKASAEALQAKDALTSATPSLPWALAEVSCPILAALSRDSRQYRLDDYLRLLDSSWSAAPQHRITVLNGGFHPIWDEPVRFMQALTALLQAQLPLDQHRHAWMLTAVDWPTRSMNLWRCVHPECPAEQALAEGLNANDSEPL
jgi:pimeloyl-ACP methyl ester carboxylesterase